MFLWTKGTQTMNVRKSLIALCLASGSIAASMPALADVYVRVAPPAPRYEVVPVVPSGYVWVPGYWDWNGHRYHWVSGHRVRAQHGAAWVPHRWVEDHGRWHMERGHWDHNHAGRDRYERDANRDHDRHHG